MNLFRCPDCGVKISKYWQFLNDCGTDYICPECGLKLRWTKWKSNMTVLSVILSVSIGNLISHFIGFSLFGIELLMGTLFSGILLFFFEVILRILPKSREKVPESNDYLKNLT